MKRVAAMEKFFERIPFTTTMYIKATTHYNPSLHGEQTGWTQNNNLHFFVLWVTFTRVQIYCIHRNLWWSLLVMEN